KFGFQCVSQRETPPTGPLILSFLARGKARIAGNPACVPHSIKATPRAAKCSEIESLGAMHPSVNPLSRSTPDPVISLRKPSPGIGKLCPYLQVLNRLRQPCREIHKPHSIVSEPRRG